MSNRRAVNALSAQHTATSTYTTALPSGSVSRVFGLLPAAGDLYVSIGHEVGADATSILVPSGTGFQLDYGVVGAVQVRSAGADQTIFMYSA